MQHGKINANNHVATLLIASAQFAILYRHEKAWIFLSFAETAMALPFWSKLIKQTEAKPI